MKSSLLVLFLALTTHEVAYAYVDPGSAGILYQLFYLLMAGVLAYFAGIKRFLLKWRGKPDSSSSKTP